MLILAWVSLALVLATACSLATEPVGYVATPGLVIDRTGW